MSLALATRGYVGLLVAASSEEEEAASPAAVESSVVAGTSAYVDHTALALARLCEYAKAKLSDG